MSYKDDIATLEKMVIRNSRYALLMSDEGGILAYRHPSDNPMFYIRIVGKPFYTQSQLTSLYMPLTTPNDFKKFINLTDPYNPGDFGALATGRVSVSWDNDEDFVRITIIFPHVPTYGDVNSNFVSVFDSRSYLGWQIGLRHLL